MLELAYRRFWIVGSIVLVTAVIWGSLETGTRIPMAGGNDKVLHFGSYCFLTVWFTGLFARNRYVWIAVALLLFGLAMEVAQHLMHAGRQADPLDMAANAAGICAGLVAAVLLLGGWARRVEAWLTT
jgi:VanZ family protein